LEPNIGDFVVFEASIKDISGLSFLPYFGQGLAFASQGLAGFNRLRGAVRALLPDRKMATILKMDDESEVELVEFRYITVLPAYELTARERDFMVRFNRNKLSVNQESPRPQMR
jgi:hypothetical protein